MERTVRAHITRDESGWYVIECLNLPVTTQGRNLDEAVSHLRQAVALALDGEDPATFGLADANPPIVVTLELVADPVPVPGGLQNTGESAWLARNLSRLGEVEPYDWQPGELGEGDPLVLGADTAARRSAQDERSGLSLCSHPLAGHRPSSREAR